MSVDGPWRLPGRRCPAAANKGWAGPLHVSPTAAARVTTQLQGLGLGLPRAHPLLVLHYGTTWPTKRWRLESWQALAVRLIRELNAMLLLTWGTEDEKEAATAIAAAGRQALVWPKGSLPELAALLASGGSGGGMRYPGRFTLPAALGTPTVSIYRATDARRNGPARPLNTDACKCRWTVRPACASTASGIGCVRSRFPWNASSVPSRPISIAEFTGRHPLACFSKKRGASSFEPCRRAAADSRKVAVPDYSPCDQGALPAALAAFVAPVAPIQAGRHLDQPPLSGYP